MIVVTSARIEGMKIVKTLDMVRGSTVRARHAGKDILAALRGMVGGEIKEYTKMLAESREEAIDRMKKGAEKIGANAIVSVRFTTSAIMKNAAELLVYGTAVKVE